MINDSKLEIKLTNSAKLLHFKSEEMELYSNNKKFYKEINKEGKKNAQKKSSFLNKLQEKNSSNNITFYEKYAYIYFNYKYSYDSNYYNIKVINDIISNEPTHIVSEFKDFLIYGDDSEFLHNNYNKSDILKYLPKIFDYYIKCSVIFPNYVVFPENKYIFKNIKRKQKLIDNQQEQEYKKEQLLKGEIDYEDDDNLFTTGAVYSILNQTNTSNIKKIFGIYKNSKNYKKNNIEDNNNNNDLSMNKLIENLKNIENKNKEKKKIQTKIIKKKQLLNLKNLLKLKFESKINNNNINLKINIKGRNNKIVEDIINNKNNNKNIFYTNINVKNSSINKIKKINKKSIVKSKSKSKILKKIKMNNYINFKNSNINKIKKNNYFYSLITDSKINHISSNIIVNGKKIRKSKVKNNNNIKSNHNSSEKNKKSIQEYFKRKISPKAIIIRMITDHNKKKLSSPKKISKKNNKENEKRPISLTLSLTNMKMISHKTKKIYNRNINVKNKSNSIANIKHKNKIIENKKNILKNNNKKKFKSLIMKEINYSGLNCNTELYNNNNNNKATNIVYNNHNDNKFCTNNNNSNNFINENKISMNLYKANSLTNIQKIKEMKKASKIKSNRHNSTLTGTTTCSYIKHSSLYYDKKTSKKNKKNHNYNQNEIIINDSNNIRNINTKYHNILAKQFPINNSNSNINININNKKNTNIENKNMSYFQKTIISPSSSIGYINNLLYERNIRKNSGILPIKKTYFNLKGILSPLTSRMSQDNKSRTKTIKSSTNNDKIHSIYNKKNIINLKNINNSWNLKSVKNIKTQTNNCCINKRAYLTTYGYFKTKK